ncbi:hypothetical protein [Pseudoxanthomonas winnipegensis]|uniref:Uncharacterized protein n=2 Tax=Pseudoxanthomonas winnipegensis TaxID=2480810 RepID=A0A4Q8LTZ9_9GAMM|nr:hypothetical protein [Pseudoxanthomonas winnipegensis]RZZ88322.1 hypothetical protein EA663_05665 [Pseudoxanthomonas winnipegensis]TAA34608.1 hypothetical protein EA656_12910 [Pseudoxanthomonas winnipegensis]
MLLAALLMSACTGPGAQHLDDAQLVKTLEQQVRLPKDASPLSDYTRYYTLTADGMLVGVYVKDFDGGDRQAHLVSKREMPLILDGGCSVINVRYDPDANKVLRVFCNGIA